MNEYPILKAQIDMLKNINKQQADRIAELEKELSWWRSNYTLPTNKKQNEPVVWMYQDKTTHEVSFQKHMKSFVDHGKTYETPLYTTPQTKPLSDEEIADMVCSGEYWKVDGLTIISVDFAKFARAIEERHGIK